MAVVFIRACTILPVAILLYSSPFGGNTLNRMVQDGPGVERSTFLEYVAANTDVQALSTSAADTTLQLGKNQARGLGAGGQPSVGRASAIDATADIEALVGGKRVLRADAELAVAVLDAFHRFGLSKAFSCAPTFSA